MEPRLWDTSVSEFFVTCVHLCAFRVAAVALSGRVQFGGVFVVSEKETADQGAAAAGGGHTPVDFSSEAFAFPEDVDTTAFVPSDAE